MKQKQSMTTIILSLIAGLVGGMISCWFFIGQAVFAEKKVTHEKVVRAERFEVVDELGNALGAFSNLNGNAFIELETKNSKGKTWLYPWLVSLYHDNEMIGTMIAAGNMSLYDPGLDHKHRNGIQLIGNSPSIVLKQDGKERIEFKVSEIRAPSSLVLFNEKGNVVWSAP